MRRYEMLPRRSMDCEMSLQESSIEDNRIRIIAERLINEELRAVRRDLEVLRSDLLRSSAIQRHELQVFYDDAMTIIRKIER